MAIWLKQAKAVTVEIGPFVDTVDGFSPKTALVLSQADVRLSKAGGSFAQKNGVASLTHQENGWYSLPLDVTDTSTLGELIIAVNETGSLPVWDEFFVVPPDTYDSFMGGTAVPLAPVTVGAELSAGEMISDLDAALARRGEDVVLRRSTSGSPKTNFDVLVRGHVRTVDADEIVGTTAQNDSNLVISPTQIISEGWPGGDAEGPDSPYEVDERVPVVGDKAIIQGRIRDVKLVKPYLSDSILVRMELLVKG